MDVCKWTGLSVGYWVLLHETMRGRTRFRSLLVPFVGEDSCGSTVGGNVRRR